MLSLITVSFRLWSKLLSNNINGKIIGIIRNMYTSAKSFIRSNDANGELFTCGIGVRQGANVSPLLFALYINYLNEFIEKPFDGRYILLVTIYNSLIILCCI